MHLRKRIGILVVAASTLTTVSTVLGQTVQPVAKSEPASDAKWLSQKAAGQWRASKMVGLNIYNNDNEKIGSISELIIDEGGKVDAVVVGAGGFLGLGEHDVAIPYGLINSIGQSPEGAHPSADKAFQDTVRARPIS
jgi:sporulation protein YlmC with PRC-barrel domain